MKHHTPPKKEISPEGSRSRRISSGVFALGNPNLSHETRVDGKRVLIWDKKEIDSYFADIAGWKNLQIDPTNLSLGNVGAISIPSGTRTANTLLAGYEAWPDEKSGVLGQIVDYTRKVQKRFGAGRVDTSVTLNSVALTREGGFFITPPHNLESDAQRIDAWKQALLGEAETALQHTVTFQQPEALIAQFSNQLEDVTRHR